jgi:hypothetical protein
MRRSVRFSLMLVACTSFSVSLRAATEADIESSFFPYAKGMPTFPGYTPGMKISKENVDRFKEILDPADFMMVKNGWFEIKTTPTISFDLVNKYIDATRAGLNKTQLGANPGEISGYTGGRPFPEEPQLGDPRAGEKIAWNFRFGVGETFSIKPVQWKYRDLMSGKIERSLLVTVHAMKFKYRVETPPIPEVTPNPSNLLNASYLMVHEPMDLKNTQLLIQRYDNDLKQDDAYMYFGFQRRVRRLATGQTTDAFLGSDVMIEDFGGYNARISETKWTYNGTRYMLLPFYKHNELALSDEYKDASGFRYVAFTGQGGCFPDIQWQLRKVYVVTGVPILASHPVSKRVFLFDAQTNTIAINQIYDRKGELWKVQILGKTHPNFQMDANKGVAVPVDDSGTMVDVQAKRCSTGQFKSFIDPKLTPPTLFQVQQLRSGD